LLRLLKSPWTFQLAATAAFMALAVWRVDLERVAEPLGRANYGWAVLALAVSTSTKVIDTMRWRVYLARVGEVPLLGLFGAFVIGNLGNNVLPFRAGDIAKIQIVANRYGLSRAGLASSVFVVESVMDGMTFLVLLLVGLALLDVGFVPAALLWSLAVSAGGGFLATVLASRLFPRQLPRWRVLRVMPARLREGLEESWPKFLDGLETMRRPCLLGKAVFLNFAGWLSQVLMFWVFGLAFGLDIPFGSYVVIMIAANLVAAFPITFQNIGTYEVVLLEILVVWGIAREEAFAYAVATHMLTNLWVVVVGLLALWLMRVRPREVFAVRTSATEDEGERLGEMRPPVR
jgi:uncharacterized protein (TIRG00374 family)